MGRKKLGHVLFARRVHPDWVPELLALIESKKAVAKAIPAMKATMAVYSTIERKPILGGLLRK